MGGGGGGGGGGNRNQYLVQQASQALELLKQETATELGIANYGVGFRGDLPSRVNGSVGGYMVKKMIALAESQLQASASGLPGGTTGGAR